MGQKKRAKGKGKKKEHKELKEEDQVEQDGLSIHSPCKSPSPSLDKLQEPPEEEVEMRLLEALEIYPPAKLKGIHRHFVLYGLADYLQRSFNKHFTADDVLKLLDRFYNLEMLEPDDDDAEILKQEEDFCLPPSFFSEEEPKKRKG